MNCVGAACCVLLLKRAVARAAGARASEFTSSMVHPQVYSASRRRRHVRHLPRASVALPSFLMLATRAAHVARLLGRQAAAREQGEQGGCRLRRRAPPPSTIHHVAEQRAEQASPCPCGAALPALCLFLPWPGRQPKYTSKYIIINIILHYNNNTSHIITNDHTTVAGEKSTTTATAPCNKYTRRERGASRGSTGAARAAQPPYIAPCMREGGRFSF